LIEFQTIFSNSINSYLILFTTCSVNWFFNAALLFLQGVIIGSGQQRRWQLQNKKTAVRN